MDKELGNQNAPQTLKTLDVDQKSAHGSSKLHSASFGQEDFSIGSTVVYGLHGKCRITGIDLRASTTPQDGTTSSPYYKLEIVKTSPGKSHRTEAAIWLPASQAHARGLRMPLSVDDLKLRLEPLFSSKEYFFPLEDTAAVLLPKLEDCLRKEGALGLAKIFSFFFVLKKRFPIIEPELQKFADLTQKLLFREISDLTEETYKIIETRLHKQMRPKLTADH